MTTVEHLRALAERIAADLGRRLALALALALTIGLTACSSPQSAAGGNPSGPQQQATAAAAGGGANAQLDPNAYKLGSGDHLQITVFGHPDLSGEFQVGSTGTVSLPLIGEVQAGGRTLRELEAAIVDKLSPGYLRDPTVAAQVLTYRLFYVIGEVKKPGGYPYVTGMRAVNAVALAGGYTYRADEGDLLIRRATGGEPVEAGPNTPVYPGDTVEVPERFF